MKTGAAYSASMRRTATVLVLTAACALSGCGGDDEGSGASTTTSDVTTTVVDATTTAPTTTEPEASTTTGPSPDVTDQDLVPDGTSFAYLTAVDVGQSTVTLDIAELLTGDAAVKAAIADGALDPGETSIDNDYYIRNKNPKLRTAAVAPTAPVNVLQSEGGADLRSGSIEELASSLASTPVQPGDTAPRRPVQVVAAGGVVTRIDEVFFP